MPKDYENGVSVILWTENAVVPNTLLPIDTISCQLLTWSHVRGGVVSHRLVVVILTCIWILAPIVPIYTMVYALVDPPENREQRSRDHVPLGLQGNVHSVHLYHIQMSVTYRRMDGPTGRRTDTPPYSDVRKHLTSPGGLAGWNRRSRRFRIDANGRTDIRTESHMEMRESLKKQTYLC